MSLLLPERFPFADDAMPYVVRQMEVSDLPAIMPIEHVSFPAPWPASAYRYELAQNELASYFVLVTAGRAGSAAFEEDGTPGVVLGYGGFWLMVGEAHISTLAVRPASRGRGLGALLLLALVDAARIRGADVLTLEVRVSNDVAQGLYRRFGFSEVGLRKRYYHDNNEDALIMTTPLIGDGIYQARIGAIREALRARHCTRAAQTTGGGN